MRLNVGCVIVKIGLSGFLTVGIIWKSLRRMEKVEAGRVYYAHTTWIFMYFADRAVTANIVVQCTITQIVFLQFVQLLIPIIFSNALWGTYVSDIHCSRFVRHKGGVLSRTVISRLSPSVIDVYGNDVFVFRDLLIASWDTALNMLALRAMSRIDWDATFAGLDLLTTGSYLYYDWTKGIVNGLPVVTHHGQIMRSVNLVFSPNNNRAALVKCEADVGTSSNCSSR